MVSLEEAIQPKSKVNVCERNFDEYLGWGLPEVAITHDRETKKQILKIFCLLEKDIKVFNELREVRSYAT